MSNIDSRVEPVTNDKIQANAVFDSIVAHDRIRPEFFSRLLAETKRPRLARRLKRDLRHLVPVILFRIDPNHQFDAGNEAELVLPNLGALSVETQ